MSMEQREEQSAYVAPTKAESVLGCFLASGCVADVAANRRQSHCEGPFHQDSGTNC